MVQQTSASIGQAAIVENRAGADGIIGTEYVARAPADGYALLVGNATVQVANMFLRKTLPRRIGMSGLACARPLPEVPTIVESGIANFAYTIWIGIIAGFDLEPVGGTPEQFDALIRAEIKKWAEVVKAAGVKIE